MIQKGRYYSKIKKLFQDYLEEYFKKSHLHFLNGTILTFLCKWISCNILQSIKIIKNCKCKKFFISYLIFFNIKYKIPHKIFFILHQNILNYKILNIS